MRELFGGAFADGACDAQRFAAALDRVAVGAAGANGVGAPSRA
ncbi:MAG: hypothetical protein U0470_01805 [Anaerolineae bacterium]